VIADPVTKLLPGTGELARSKVTSPQSDTSHNVRPAAYQEFARNSDEPIAPEGAMTTQFDLDRVD